MLRPRESYMWFPALSAELLVGTFVVGSLSSMYATRIGQELLAGVMASARHSISA